MADIKLFKLSGNSVTPLEAQSVAVEKSLQVLVEKHLDAFLGVRFLATEYSTGVKHGGRIDTLGLDENGCPVIIEYKRTLNENVINQGLYYLDWLLDHKAEFELLVMKKLSMDAAEQIDWSSPRLLCIAGDFTKYDEHAVQQINRNIELIRYRRYGDELLLLELVSVVEADAEADVPEVTISTSTPTGPKYTYKTITEYMAEADVELRDRYEAIRAFLAGLGSDVQVKVVKYYIAFKRIKNFVCATLGVQSNTVTLWLKLDPATVQIEEGFTRDVTKIGHYGTGDIEVTIRTADDIEKAKPLLIRAYEEN